MDSVVGQAARTRGNVTRHPGDMTGFPTKMQPRNTAHKKAHKGLVHWEDPEGSGGEGGGRGDRDGEHM